MSETDVALGLVVCCEHGSSFLLLISIWIKKLWGERWNWTAQWERVTVMSDLVQLLTIILVSILGMFFCIWHEDIVWRAPDVRCGQCDRFVPSSGDLVTRNTGHWSACLQTVWVPRSLVGARGCSLSLLSPGTPGLYCLSPSPLTFHCSVSDTKWMASWCHQPGDCPMPHPSLL